MFIAEKILQTYHVNYSKIEGTFVNGITVYDINYKNILKAKKIQLNYKLLSFIELKPIIKTLNISSLYLNVNKIPSSHNKDTIDIIPFDIRSIKLTNTRIKIGTKEYDFNFSTKNLSYDKTFSTKHFDLNLRSFYANADIKGRIYKNVIKAYSNNAKISQYVRKHYINTITDIPSFLHVNLFLDKNRINLTSDIKHFAIRSNTNVNVIDQHLSVSYLFHQNIFDIDYDYNLQYNDFLIAVSQSGTITPHGKYTSKLAAKLIKYPVNISLPIQSFNAKIRGDLNSINIDANSSNYKLNAFSDDFHKFFVKLSNKKMNLSFLQSLPEKLKKQTFAFDSSSSIVFSPLHIDTTFHTHDNLADINATFNYSKKVYSLKANAQIRHSHEYYKKYKIFLINPVKINLTHREKINLLQINADLLHMTVKENNQLITGNGNLASCTFSLRSQKKSRNFPFLKINATIPSLKVLLQQLQLAPKKEETIYNGKIDIKSTLYFKNIFSLRSTITAPWLSMQTNANNKYTLTDTLFQLTYADKKINIYKYHTYFKDQKFSSNKLSQIHIDKNTTVQIDNFYVLKNLDLTGIIKPMQSQVKLNLQGKNVNVKTQDANLNADVNINIDVNSTKSQSIDGNITLLNGTISYVPPHSYNISDPDIIIIQDEKKKKSSNLNLKLHIIAANSILYKTKQANVKFIPDIFILKKPAEDFKYIGKIIILDGEVTLDSRKFTFANNTQSEIILRGRDQFNPQLNLNLHYETLDYKKITIRVTNTLSSPILIFSSNPPMSQNDIMSYILFGEPASTLFNNSSSGSKTSLNYLLLGSGIKNIFNKGLGLHVDTLNILNNENGTLGYEVGARLSKKLRIIYKNNITSSVILQYILTSSLRIDLDVHDTGQGVYFIYTKDFRDFLK